MIDEHIALLRHCGRVQTRCSSLIEAQAAEIARLRAQAVRLRASHVIRDTAQAWQLESSMPTFDERNRSGIRNRYRASHAQA